ncbi:long-chain fatty acid--CoA ligase [Micrococcus sp.]|uniref:AMP-dependent synthetase/ligase n=1 Tax=Micrococcus sp. TaxID=1271 RepID=UPI0026DCE6F2|nr:long-chain fatty acid--CoA ligase [Micrococcus sp.]MDO4239204.1 long-chain fatty acid--CoA ligase [Micrococcus sp.]
MHHETPTTEASTDVVDMPPAETNVTDLILASAAEAPRAPVYAVRNGAGAWLDVRFDTFLDQVRAVAKGLMARGVGRGDRVALFAATSYEWAVLDQAVWFAGAVSVPIYETSSAHQVAHILSDSGTVLAGVGTPALDERTREAAALASCEVDTFPMTPEGLAALARAGRNVPDAELEAARAAATLSDPASIVYTSGTTGLPKGAIITHGNFAGACVNVLAFAAEVVGHGHEEPSRSVMFLPLAHVLAHAVQVICLYARIQLAHAPSTATLLKDLGSFRPTWLLAVPRVFEKVEAGIAAKAEKGGTGRLYRAARATAVEWSEAVQSRDHGDGPGPSAALSARRALFDRLVYRKVRQALGGQVRYCVSGASALSPELTHVFHGMGVPIVEGYGLTETTAPATVNIPGAHRIGTVGLPAAGVTVRIAEDGEILIAGPVVFGGYHGRPEASAESFDGEFFRTGDIGALDEDGYLRITGRKKEVIVTAGGKNVYPTPLEEIIRRHRLVEHAVVVGDDRPYVGALIVLDQEELTRWSLDRERTLTLAEAATDPQVLASLQEAVDEANETVSRAESIRRIRVLDHVVSEESGHLTQSQKLKRSQLIEDFADEVEALYHRR